MIGFEVVASLVVFVLLAVAVAMAIIGLLGAGGALAIAPCPACRHLGVTTLTWRYCPYCAPGTVSSVLHARVPHLHWHPHPHLPHLRRKR